MLYEFQGQHFFLYHMACTASNDVDGLSCECLWLSPFHEVDTQAGRLHHCWLIMACQDHADRI